MMISVYGLTRLTLRMNSSVPRTSPSGSGGLPSTNENSGTIPYSRAFSAMASVLSVDAEPPLFMRLSVSSEPDSAPMNTMRRPLSRMSCQDLSEYRSNVSMRDSPHQPIPRSRMRSANSA